MWASRPRRRQVSTTEKHAASTSPREAAGLPRHIDQRQLRAIHSREWLLDQLRAAVDEHGDNVTLSQFRRMTELSIPPI